MTNHPDQPRRLADRTPQEHQQIRRFLADALGTDQAGLNAAIHRGVADHYDHQ
ncbi:MAG TPA: hypothetical protein VFA46_04575 [Actinomycetes bacterium]|jgi:hypothetical protein|nr:hypothetical protein [Actinomycetes bacterium]